jgi:hypothetical protein
MDTKSPNQIFYVSLDDLQSICAKLGQETWLSQIMTFVYVCSTWVIVDLKSSVENWITRSYESGVR